VFEYSTSASISFVVLDFDQAAALSVLNESTKPRASYAPRNVD
jgi:hypothetical protein